MGDRRHRIFDLYWIAMPAFAMSCGISRGYAWVVLEVRALKVIYIQIQVASFDFPPSTQLLRLQFLLVDRFY
jgi:hypothetical protein